MIKVICTTKFIDKKTKHTHHIGDVFEVSEARLKEILAAGDFVKEVAEEVVDEQPTEVAEEKATEKKSTTKKTK